MSGIFRLQAPLYRAMGLWPRPVWPGAKACQIPHWQKPDPEQPEGALQRWTEQYGDFGIGLVMGSPLPDGTRLGALDIDRDDYLRVARVLLGDPECGRIGKKGAVFFVRLAGQFHTTPLRVKSEGGQLKVGECLFDRAFCVIPPTIHPETETAYRWIGKPLLEMDLAQLPLIQE